MTVRIAHLASGGDPHFTACGEPWQGWQEPKDAIRRLTGSPRPPHHQGRPGERVDQCQACLRVAMSAPAATVPLGYHVLSGEDLLEMLRRCAAGEDADLVYAEHYANAEHEHIEGKDAA